MSWWRRLLGRLGRAPRVPDERVTRSIPAAAYRESARVQLLRTDPADKRRSIVHGPAEEIERMERGE